jgi:hypothetical protein
MLSAGIILLGRAEAAAPRADPEKVKLARKFVDGLNADAYTVRVKARESLLKLGRAAIEPLEFATKAEESETRLRAVELLIELRGRGLLGIGMLDTRFGDTLPEVGAGVKSVLTNNPAEKAGLQQGDVIVALNDEPIENNNELQSYVFSTGPARVMDVLVDRGGEKMRFSVLLTLNLSGSMYGSGAVMPPVDLESELPESDDPKGRQQARMNVAALNGQVIPNAGIMIVNGQVVQNTNQVQPEPAKPIDENINIKALEADFERVKVEAEKGRAVPKAPAKDAHAQDE